MNTNAERTVWMPGWAQWMDLAALIILGLATNWLIAAGLLAVFLRQVARPFDFLTSYFMVTIGATFIRYDAGQLTIELSLLSALILFMLISYTLSAAGLV